MLLGAQFSESHKIKSDGDYVTIVSNIVSRFAEGLLYFTSRNICFCLGVSKTPVWALEQFSPQLTRNQANI